VKRLVRVRPEREASGPRGESKKPRTEYTSIDES